MLDLSTLKKQTYSIKLQDKTVLKIKKPSQKIYLQLREIEANAGTEDLEIIETLYEILCDIFNRNINDRTFTVDDIKEITDEEPTIATAILEDYLKFVENELKK